MPAFIPTELGAPRHTRRVVRDCSPRFRIGASRRVAGGRGPGRTWHEIGFVRAGSEVMPMARSQGDGGPEGRAGSFCRGRVRRLRRPNPRDVSASFSAPRFRPIRPTSKAQAAHEQLVRRRRRLHRICGSPRTPGQGSAGSDPRARKSPPMRPRMGRSALSRLEKSPCLPQAGRRPPRWSSGVRRPHIIFPMPSDAVAERLISISVGRDALVRGGDRLKGHIRPKLLCDHLPRSADNTWWTTSRVAPDSEG